MSAPAQKFKVADLSLAAFGRREIGKLQANGAENEGDEKLTDMQSSPSMRCPVS